MLSLDWLVTDVPFSKGLKCLIKSVLRCVEWTTISIMLAFQFLPWNCPWWPRGNQSSKVCVVWTYMSWGSYHEKPRVQCFYYFTGKPEIQVGKSNGPHHFIWEASKNMGCGLRRCNKFIFLPFSVCSVDLDLLCSGSFTHHFQFNILIFLHKISTQVVCVNGSPQESNSVVQNQWVPVQKPILILLVILYYSWLLHEKFLQFDWFRAFSLICNT